MNALDPFLVLAVAAGVLALAMLAWALMERRRAGAAETRNWELRERYADTEARMRLFEDQSAAQGEYLRAQAQQQAGAVAEELLKRTDETFRNRELMAQQRIEAQLKPVAETLAKFEAQVQAVEKVRAEETGGLKQQIQALMEASTATQHEARKLSAALRRGAGVQGRWGEQTLRNVGRRRPDVKVKMPAGAVFAIDAKCSLNAFLDAQEATDDVLREAAYARHAQSVRAHMQGLSAKAYWDQFASERSPDFVAMFVPGDGFLAAALDRMPDLMTEAMDKRVLLVTPTTLFALCKAVAYGWRVEEQAANADKIAALGRELYKRLSVMGGHASSVGKALEAAVSRYNQFVGSLETQVLTQARRFEELKVDHEGKEIPEISHVETAVRPLTKLSGGESPTLTVSDAAPTS
ncbi:MAG: DNA recombination protein RmuC [Pseudomonadota bacterium]